MIDLAEYKKNRYGYTVEHSKYSRANNSLKKNRYRAEDLTEARAYIDKVGFDETIAMIQIIKDRLAILEPRKKSYLHKHIVPNLEQALIKILEFMGHSQYERTELAMKNTKASLEELKEKVNNYRPGKNVYIKTNYFIIDSLFNEYNKGILEGTVTLLSGSSGSGKSTLALNIAKSFIDSGRNVYYFDTEFGLNNDTLEKTKMLPLLYNKDSNPEGRFMIIQEQDYSGIEKLIDAIIQESKPSLIIIDSVTAIRPKQAESMSAEEELIGLQSKLMSNFFLKYKGLLNASNTSILMCNQLRYHIDTNKGRSEEVESGGCALQHYPDYRIMITPVKKKEQFFSVPSETERISFKNEDDHDGIIHKIYCEKSRGGKPYRSFKLPILFGEGISESMSLKYLLIDMSIISSFPNNNYLIGKPFQEKRITSEASLLNWINENMEMIKNTLIKKHHEACE